MAYNTSYLKLLFILGKAVREIVGAHYEPKRSILITHEVYSQATLWKRRSQLGSKGGR